MNWNDLESTWKRQPTPALSPAGLIESFESKRRAEARQFFWRDLREGSVSLGLCIYFSYKTWQLGPGYWPIGLAVLLFLALGVFFFRERLRARRARPHPALPLLAKVDADLAELRHQHRLYATVTAWGLAPIALSIAIIVGTVLLHKPEALHSARNVWFVLGYGLIVVALFWFIRNLNQRILRRQVEPRIGELERLRDSLTSTQ